LLRDLATEPERSEQCLFVEFQPQVENDQVISELENVQIQAHQENCLFLDGSAILEVVVDKYDYYYNN